MEVGYGPYSRLESLDDQESFSLVTLIKSIAMGNFPTYRVAKASKYLVITRAGIDDIKIAKNAWIFPGQSCATFDISPSNYTFKVQAMSADKIPFILPAEFVIGPRTDDKDCLYKYAKLIPCQEKDTTHIHELVKGTIEGETRVLAASMTMEEISRGTKKFKKEVFDKVQLELCQFGLLIYTASIKQLVDVPGHEYFSYLGLKTQMEAADQAKIDVFEAKMKDLGCPIEPRSGILQSTGFVFLIELHFFKLSLNAVKKNLNKPTNLALFVRSYEPSGWFIYFPSSKSPFRNDGFTSIGDLPKFFNALANSKSTIIIEVYSRNRRISIKVI
ncbi:SPFH/band 7/PHB domain membrane-associated family protein [Tanacetum coccineum]